MITMFNGRTPEEIKQGLECCSPRYESKHWVTCNGECPFGNEGVYCRNVLNACIKRYIQQLECERDEARNDLDTINYANTELHSAYEAMKRERDAAVERLKDFSCGSCKHECVAVNAEPCQTCFNSNKWEFDGVEVE